jgi:hypothetical protein
MKIPRSDLRSFSFSAKNSRSRRGRAADAQMPGRQDRRALNLFRCAHGASRNGRKTKADFFRFIGQTIGDAFDAVLKMFLAEVDQRPSRKLARRNCVKTCLREPR